MGMFDYVNFEMDCPKCGTKVTGFQSKDAGCQMDTINPDAVECMYSSCDTCGTWLELEREVESTPARPTPYALSEAYALGFKLKQGQ